MSEEEKISSKGFFEDLTTDYANNVAVEATIWDLKLVFGEYSDRDKSVNWHSSITIPWAQAKLLSHYLQVNVAVRELSEGPISIPDVMIPQAPPPLTAEQEKDPEAKAVHDTISALQAAFISDLKRT